MPKYSFFNVEEITPESKVEIKIPEIKREISHKCNYCIENFTELSDKIQHEEKCDKNPQNFVSCEFCGKKDEPSKIEKHELKCKENPKNQEKEVKNQIPNQTLETISAKLDEIRNFKDLILLGKKHSLSIETLIQYFEAVSKTKLYELKRYFDENSVSEIESLLKGLYKKRIVKRDKNNWYSLNRKSEG